MELSEKTNRSEAVLILLEERVFALDVLRRIFIDEPSRDLLKVLLKQELIQNFPFKEENLELSAGVEMVVNYLKNFDFKGDEEFKKLHWDYTRMFIGPYKLPAPPWESAYLDDERMLFQETTLQVRRSYLKYSFIPRYYLQEADDHLGLELDFMYRLSQMAVDKLQSQDISGLKEILEDQKDFLEQHLLKWIPAFSGHVVERSDTEFYQGMGKVLKYYLQLDHQVLGEILEEFRY